MGCILVLFLILEEMPSAFTIEYNMIFILFYFLFFFIVVGFVIH